MQKHKNQHEWTHLGFSTAGNEYGYCDLCKQYRRFQPNQQPIIITKAEFLAAGPITPNECPKKEVKQ